MSNNPKSSTPKVMVVFGTRPEVIKLAPVVRALEDHPALEPVVVGSGQHAHLMGDFANQLGTPIHHDLACGRPNQTLLGLHGRLLESLDKVMQEVRPSLVLVQGDTATTLAGAQVAFAHKIPVGHVEAGLRSGDRKDPFPEEMNRRLIGQMSDLHFCATERNRAALLSEGFEADMLHVTGNTVVDAVQWACAHGQPTAKTADLLAQMDGKRLIVLTTHRRESFGDTMHGRLRVLAKFIADRPDTELIFPVHPNPKTKEAAEAVLGGLDRIHLVDPMGYFDFIHTLRSAWLIVTDSGGLQEEAPSLGRPAIVIRTNTERPEALESGVARLATPGAEALQIELERAETDGWPESVAAITNPFGDGTAGSQIVSIVNEFVRTQREVSAPQAVP